MIHAAMADGIRCAEGVVVHALEADWADFCDWVPANEKAPKQAKELKEEKRKK